MALKSKVVNIGDNLPTKQQITLFARGITCISCVYRIESELLRLDGVIGVNVDLANEKVTVEFIPEKATVDQLIAAINQVGYEALLDQEEDAETEKKARKKERQLQYQKQKNMFWLSALLSSFFIPQIFSDLGMKYGLFTGFAFSLTPLTQFLLVTPIQFYVGARFYKGAFKALQNGSVTMDVLVALSTSVVYFFGIIQSVKSAGGNVYYEVVAIVITLLQLGKLLETRRLLRKSND